MRPRLNALFAISGNSPSVSMVNFPCWFFSALELGARGVTRRVPLSRCVRQFEWKLGSMLIYDQPIGGPGLTPDRRRRRAGRLQRLDLARLLWRRRVAIASAALLSACVAVAVGKSLTPKYTATAQLYVDPRELQLVDREMTPRPRTSTASRWWSRARRA